MNKNIFTQRFLKTLRILHYLLVLYWIIATIRILFIDITFISYYIKEGLLFSLGMFKNILFAIITLGLIVVLSFYVFWDILKSSKIFINYNNEKIINKLVFLVLVLLQIIPEASLEYFTLELSALFSSNGIFYYTFSTLFSDEVFAISFLIILKNKRTAI